MGCRHWSISGGEPMLREDFEDIFDHITSRSAGYSLNTNGTLITPAIARLMRRKGSKMISLYGATADIHDHVTRNPGSFEAAMNGMALLKEAGAGFTVQIVPLRANYHQVEDMIKLARSLSPLYRFGAYFINLSASGSPATNREILKQRLDPGEVIRLDNPDAGCEENDAGSLENNALPCCAGASSRRLIVPCCRMDQFHIDPYGRMGTCVHITDADLRFDLRKGSFAQAWNEFIPSLADRIVADREYDDGCGRCENRAYCTWCPALARLECGRYTAKVDYLCGLAEEKRRHLDAWKKEHRRYYAIGGVTIRVDSDLPITDQTFHEKLEKFRVEGPGEDNICIRHHFELPEIGGRDLGQEVYRHSPWRIYHKGRSWIYIIETEGPDGPRVHKVAVFNEDYTRGEIYSENAMFYLRGGLDTLTTFPSDHILITHPLADRQACIMHAAGMAIDGQGLLFAGHSEAGKSTTVTMLKDAGEILCDDRIVVRRWPDGFRIHGTWSHGTVPEISPHSAPLRAIFLIEKSPENRLVRIQERREILRTLPFYTVKSLATPGWWDKTLSLVEAISREVPVYRLKLDKSGQVKEVIKAITGPGIAENSQPPAGEST